MPTYSEVGGNELRWVKPKWSKRQFELRDGENVIATLAWSSGSGALGEWAGGQYGFRREGWFRQRTLIWQPANATPDAPQTTADLVATFAHRDGTLTMADGQVYFWRKPRFWTREHVWTDSSGTALVHVRPAGWRSTVVLRCEPEAAALPELPLLLLLSQFLAVLAADDEAAASVAATVAAGANT